MTSPYDQKIVSLDDLRDIRARLGEKGKRIVQCHGCFDIVHPGHIRYLRFARSLGDVLIVTVSADEVVMKGAQRPFFSSDLRLENLAELECVDYVALSTDTWAGPALECVRPDVYVKGKEYETGSDPRFVKEKNLVEKNGGSVVLGSGDVVFSSTALGEASRNLPALEQQKIKQFCATHGITRAKIESLIRALGETKVLVIGDAIVDEYIQCEDARVASEAPILTVRPTDQASFVGGAALIARQLAIIGTQVHFITAGSNDAGMARVIEVLEEASVTTEVIEIPHRPTFMKTRYLIERQKVFKIDRGAPTPLPIDSVDRIIHELESRLPQHDGLVVTDFGYGFFGDRLCSAIADLSVSTQTPYFADVSSNGHANILKFGHARCATPTETELRFSLADGEAGLSNLAARYFEQTQGHGLMVTLGRNGALHFRPPEPGEPRLSTAYLPALTPSRQDAVGAGDMFLAGVTAAALANEGPEMGMYLGATLATVSTSRIGNDGAPLEDVLGFLASRDELV